MEDLPPPRRRFIRIADAIEDLSITRKTLWAWQRRNIYPQSIKVPGTNIPFIDLREHLEWMRDPAAWQARNRLNGKEKRPVGNRASVQIEGNETKDKDSEGTTGSNQES